MKKLFAVVVLAAVALAIWLKVTYGDRYELRLTSEEGRGTCARLEIPETAVAVKP